MFKKYFPLMLISICFIFQGCAALFDPESSEMKRTAIDRAVYEPYEKRKTIEGYEEFIAKYPYNRFAAAARREIDDLRFAAVRKINTIEGYSEFINKYPYNPNVPAAKDNIEKLELAFCRKENTSACYEDFISRHPQSMFLNEAEKDLQELEMNRFSRVLKENYGFDLPLYRLNLNRLKKELILEGKEDLGDFTFFVSFIIRDGKKYFSTHLTFNNENILAKIAEKIIPDEIFDDIIAGQLEYLNIKFKGKQKIDGFSFGISSFPLEANQRKTLLECFFPLDETDQFARGRIDKETLVKKTIVIPYSESQPPAVQETKRNAGQQMETPFKVQEASETVSLKWTSENDGLVKGGKFIRVAPPAFSLSFPEDWKAERAGDKFVFKANDPLHLPAMKIGITKISGDEAVDLKSFPSVITESLRKEGGSNTNVLYSKPSDVYEGLPAYEFEINYKPKNGRPLPRLTVYVNVIAKDGYAIILEGESSGDIDRLKMIYESMNLKP